MYSLLQYEQNTHINNETVDKTLKIIIYIYTTQFV